MKSYAYLIPWFPISAFVFMVCVLVGSWYGVVPGQSEMLEITEKLYTSWGLPALGLGALLETVAYFGLYFPGAVLILLSVIVTSGEISMFMLISGTVALGSVLGGLISYYMGIFSRKRLGQPTSGGPTSWGWFVFGHWNLNALGLWFFKQGFDGKPLYPYIILSPLIVFPYGMMWCYILFATRNFFSEDRWVELFIIIGVWALIDMFLKYQKHEPQTS